jgi:ABC-type lipoprotein export system ATPase subunit
MTAVVELRDLFRVYPSAEGGVAALQGLTLSVTRGELCVVLGPSGSGKSTLLRIVAGFDRPSAGSATVAGTDVAALGSWAAGRFRSRSIGYADQHYWRALAGELTARELVGVQLGLAGVAREERERRSDELLERVGLGARRDAHPRELSGGEQQRVALCAAVAGRPDLLIADEPTGELDAATAGEVLALIAELVRSEGSTALVVSHDPASAERADRVVHVRDGRVSAEHVSGAAAAGDGAIVVGRGGWLRLPEDLLRSAGISERAVAHLDPRADAPAVIVAAPAREARVSETQAPLAPRNEAVSAPGKGASGSETQAPLVEVRGLVRGFGGGVTPIHGLTVAFAPATVTAVTGPSGSGKTTLLHLLAGLDLPDAGEVLVDGISIAGLDRAARAELRRTRVAFVGQEAGLVPFLGARENVELALSLRGVEGDAGAALEAVGLAEHAERPVAELSAGQRVRAALARAIAPRPLVLLADEPTARLDAANALALGTLLADLAREHGATVICATHDPLLIEQAGAELPLRSR